MSALSPSQAIRRPNIEADVARINAALLDEWSTYERTYGKFVTVATMTQAGREAAAAEFRAAGWEVQIVSDRLTEPSLVFRPHVPPSTSHDC